MKKILFFLILLVGYAGTAQEAIIVKQDSLPEKKLEKIPEYVGGQQAFKDLIKRKTERIKITKSQIIHASFVVEKDGSTSNIVISENTEPKMAKKLRKIIEKSKWSPGYSNGKLSRVKFTFPMTVKTTADGGLPAN